MAAGFLQPLLDSPGSVHALCDAATAAVVATQVLPAFDSASRKRGLLGRDHLDAGTALVLAPCEAVHTFFMRFPIDIAFVSESGAVLAVRRAVRPWRIAVSPRAFATIELGAGALAAAGVRVGDRLRILPVTDIHPAAA